MKKVFTILFLFCFIIFSFTFGQSLIINEIHADPDPTEGDANGDGTISTDDDEFVELINTTGSDLDISNWTLSDGIGIRHTFPNPTIIPSGQSIVVFGGGTPTNIPGTVQVTGTLGLNNDGDVITVKNSVSTVIDSYTYGNDGGDNQSITRSPDITGSFVKHTTISTNPVRFSPGRDNTDNSPLPVEISILTASLKGKEVNLKWTTKTEVNNYGFEIERSLTPTPSQREETFNWERIGFVSGAGNTNTPRDHSFTDKNTFSFTKLSYRLKRLYNDGQYEYSKVVEVDLGAAKEFALNQNYPNPFNPATLISYTIPQAVHVKLSVFNVLGSELAVLVDEYQEAGYYSKEFSVADHGLNLTNGVYFYKLEAGNFTETKKFILMK